MKKIILSFAALTMSLSLTIQAQPVPSMDDGSVIRYKVNSFEQGSFKIKVFTNLATTGLSVQVLSDNMDQPVSLSVFDLAGNRKEDRTIKPGVIAQIGTDYTPGVYVIKASQGSRKASLELVKPDKSLMF